jgi:FKBP-type peptidyl-prolyl cis-trans isomerase (trigger factor)
MSETKIKIKDSTAEIEGEVAWETLEKHRSEVLEELRQEFAAPGFRKGHVPMEVFLKHVDEHHVLEDAAERLLQDTYPLLIEEHKLEPLGRPEVTITKLAAGNPLGFMVRVGIAPEVKLPNYLKIAKEIVEAAPVAEVTQEEIDKVINELRGLRREKDAPADAPLPELTDEFVKTLGAFDSVEDFRKKLAENLKLEKENERTRERREKIAAALGEKTKMTLPAGFLDMEAQTMQERLVEDLKNAKISMEDYLAKMKKTPEELLAEHRGWAERQLTTRFILDAIAKAENLAADPDELAMEVHYLRQQHPQTDPSALERYAETLLRNEEVLKFLESGGVRKEPATSEPTASQPKK